MTNSAEPARGHSLEDIARLLEAYPQLGALVPAAIHGRLETT